MLIHVAEKLVGYFENAKGQGTEAEAKQAGMALTINDFLFSTGIDNVNLFQLLRQAFLEQVATVWFVLGTRSCNQNICCLLAQHCDSSADTFPRCVNGDGEDNF